MEAINTLPTANEIARQIGHKALFMLGAKNLLGDAKSLTFKIQGSPKRVTHVRVTLKASDTYEMEFLRCVGTKAPALLARTPYVYADQLCSVIETETALRTSL